MTIIKKNIILKKRNNHIKKGPNFCAKEDDVVEIMLVAEKFANHVNKIEANFIERMQRIEASILKLKNK
jgi:hypothetical protein